MSQQVVPSDVLPSHMTAQIAHNPKLKVWQAWPGSHQFLCDGRLMVGPDIGVTTFAAVLTTAASISFWVFVGPHLPVAYTVGNVILYVLTMVFMFLTATTDPGVVPQYAASFSRTPHCLPGKTHAARGCFPLPFTFAACLPRALAQQSIDG